MVSDQQRKPPVWRPWLMLGAVLVVLALVGTVGYQAWLQYRPRTEVEVVQVVSKTGTVNVKGTSFEAAGWIEPDPFPDYVSTLIEGWVTSIPVIEGDTVEKGQLLATLYDEDYRLAVDEAEADRDVLQAEARYLKSKLDIDTRLLKEGAIDKLVLEKTTAEYDRIQAELRRAELKVTLAERNLARCRITAPVSGVVLRRFVSIGQHLAPRSHTVNLMSLYHPDRLQVRVDVNLIDVEKAAIDTECELKVESVPGKVFKGVVSRIVHEADNQKNTVQFKVRILEPEAALKPEMLCRVQFLASDKTGTSGGQTAMKFIPERAIVQEGGQSFVFVSRGAWPHTVAAKVPVTVGNARDGDLVEIREGLDLSSKVIVTGVGELVDGEPILVKGTP